MGKAPEPDSSVSNTKDVAKALGNVTVVRKGYHDVISDGVNGQSTRLEYKWKCFKRIND